MKKLGRLIETIEELKNNLLQVELYLIGIEGVDARMQMCKLISRGSVFVAYQLKDGMHFAPSRFLGYLNNKWYCHIIKNNGKDGTITTPRISALLHCNPQPNIDLEKKYIHFCETIGVQPKKMNRTERKYWLIETGLVEDEYIEGELKQFSTNQYERNPEARRKAIEYHGVVCCVCGFDFEKVYGELGKGFIHIHHTTPISKIGKTYVVNPKTDLVPVCPNCHAMLHKGKDGKILTIEELKLLLNERVNKG